MTRIRGWLDRWEFWTGVAYFGLAALVVGLFVVNQRSRTAAITASRAVTLRIADRNASASAEYAACLHSIPELERIDRFVGGVRYLAATLYVNSVAMHLITQPGTRTYITQARNLRRLRAASLEVSGVTFHVPTRAHCEAARKAALAHP